LAGITAPQALLWFSQFLNGLCGLGIFLLLDRKVTRDAGIVGMLSVGLFSISHLGSSIGGALHNLPLRQFYCQRH